MNFKMQETQSNTDLDVLLQGINFPKGQRVDLIKSKFVEQGLSLNELIGYWNEPSVSVHDILMNDVKLGELLTARICSKLEKICDGHKYGNDDIECKSENEKEREKEKTTVKQQEMV